MIKICIYYINFRAVDSTLKNNNDTNLDAQQERNQEILKNYQNKKDEVKKKGKNDKCLII